MIKNFSQRQKEKIKCPVINHHYVNMFIITLRKECRYCVQYLYFLFDIKCKTDSKEFDIKVNFFLHFIYIKTRHVKLVKHLIYVNETCRISY